jgi:SAM-dependent methyltransferase
MITPASGTACPSCDCRPQSFRVLGEKGVVRLLECPSCGLVFADPERWRNPYAQVDYYDPEKQPEASYPLQPDATDADRLATLCRHVASGQLLEFGGGLGRTALAAQRAGFHVTVLEESGKAVADGRRHHPELTWEQGSEVPGSFPAASFSAVTVFHVLEHIPRPVALVESFARILRPGGFLLIEVPNWGSRMRQWRGLGWGFVMDHHVNYFTRDTLVRLVEPRGFALAETVYRRTFAINEEQPWKEPFKRAAAWLGFGDILRCVFRRT